MRRPAGRAREPRGEPEDIGAINRTDEDFDRLADGRPVNRDDPALGLFGSLVEDVRHGPAVEPAQRGGRHVRAHHGRHALAAGAGALAASLVCVTGAAAVTGLNPVAEVTDGLHELVDTPNPLGTPHRPVVHGGGGVAPSGHADPTGSRGPDDRRARGSRPSGGGSGAPAASSAPVSPAPKAHADAPDQAATRTGSDPRLPALSGPAAPLTGRTTIRPPSRDPSPGVSATGGTTSGPGAPPATATPSAGGTTPGRRTSPVAHPTPGPGSGPETGPSRSARPRTGGPRTPPGAAYPSVPPIQPNGG